LNSKLLASHREFFAEIVVNAVLTLDQDLSLDLIGIKKVTGGALEVCYCRFKHLEVIFTN
jgi:T-complex protein 1 subunit eta